MLKTLITFLLIFSGFSSLNASEDLRIYSRAEWGANEDFRSQDSVYWKKIIAGWNRSSKAWKKKRANYSSEKKAKIDAKNKVKAEKRKKMNAYLVNNFGKYIKVQEYKKYEGKNKLAWAISKTNYVKNIVIHHTYSEYKDSFTGIKNIYKYHSLSRQWGDIGYHYIIGYDGEIFEGRAGGDYVVAAHDTWNNYSTVGISIMGNYDKRHLTNKQYNSLKKLVQYLTKKYGIDLNKKIPYHRECFGNKCENGLETNYYYPIVGHRDGKGTACPGKDIYYNIIPKLIKELQPETKGYKLITYTEVKEREKKYKDKIGKYDWAKFKKNFNKKTKIQKENIIYKIETILRNKNLFWQKRLIFEKILVELNVKN